MLRCFTMSWIEFLHESSDCSLLQVRLLTWQLIRVDESVSTRIMEHEIFFFFFRS